MLNFTRSVIAFRKRSIQHCGALSKFLTESGPGNLTGDVVWRMASHPANRASLLQPLPRLTLNGKLTGHDPDCDLYLAFNAWQSDLVFGTAALVNPGGGSSILRRRRRIS